MPDPMKLPTPEEVALNSAKNQYSEWNQWERIVDDGWLALADYTACTWCGAMIYPALKHLHRTHCRGPLEGIVPEPLPVEVVQELQLDTYYPQEISEI